MPLELRPNCECCDKDLPVDAADAMICTYECTFCKYCVETVLLNVCPNCGGGFENRPIRPALDRRKGVSRVFQPASTNRRYAKYSEQEMRDFAQEHHRIQPHDR